MVLEIRLIYLKIKKNTTEILLQQVKLQFEFYSKILNDKILSLKDTKKFDPKNLIDKLEALREYAVKIKHEARLFP